MALLKFYSYADQVTLQAGLTEFSEVYMLAIIILGTSR